MKEELPIKYNLRFLEAFSKQKIKPWLFSGPIVIEEANQFSGLAEYFLVDKWCVLGSVTSSDISQESQIHNQQTMQFDLDTYKILLSFFRNKDNAKKIHILSAEESSVLFGRLPTVTAQSTNALF